MTSLSKPTTPTFSQFINSENPSRTEIDSQLQQFINSENGCRSDRTDSNLAGGPTVPLAALDLDSVAREIAETPPPPEPSPELTAKAGAYLERRGWTRAVAGEADFAAASLALARCSVQRRGLFAFGAYGCGKTAFVMAIRPLFEPVHFVPLNDPEYAELMDLDLWPNWNAEAMRCSVILDDLGAESAITDYGIKRELAAEFVVRYHREGGGRLFVTTNLTGEEIAERYTARLTSRIKELCIPLHLTGADKRKWGAA